MAPAPGLRAPATRRGRRAPGAVARSGRGRCGAGAGARRVLDEHDQRALGRAEGRKPGPAGDHPQADRPLVVADRLIEVRDREVHLSHGRQWEISLVTIVVVVGIVPLSDQAADMVGDFLWGVLRYEVLAP